MRSSESTFLSLSFPATVLIVVLFAFTPSAVAGTSTEPNGGPAALIKNIVINDEDRTVAKSSEAIVTRTSGKTVSVTTGLLLYRGDLIETFAKTKLTVLYLDDPVSEKANEVIIDADSRVGISSTDSWWGRIQAKIKGTFRSQSRYVRLGAKGTEYDFNVFKGEERSELIMLEGTVKADEGNFPLVGAKQTSEAAPEFRTVDAFYSVNFFKAFAHRSTAQEEFGRTVDVVAGRSETFVFTFTISNNCRKPHQFEFHTSSSTSWLQLEIEQGGSVSPGTSQRIEGVVKADATNLQPGNFRGRIYATCIDCASETNCNRFQKEWPINLTVKGGMTTTPSPSPTPTPSPKPSPITTPSPLPSPSPTSSSQEMTVQELEKVTFTRGVDQPFKARANDVIEALNWTNDVILPAQPTYVARNLMPHFYSVAERGLNFRTARQDSILSKDKSGSNKILGDIYSDWGEGTRALFAYQKELVNDSSQRNSASFMADLSDAYRVTGKLKDAKQTLVSIPAADQQSSAVRNAAGNLNLTNADVALDKGDPEGARGFLKNAEEDYNKALKGQPTRDDRSNRNDSNVTIQTNLGEVYLASGNIALQQEQTDEARRQFDAAALAFTPLQQTRKDYPHPITDLGKAYQGLGRVETLEGNVAEAKAAYGQAEAQHKRAIATHSDFAEAYFNLGDVYVDLGNKEAAKDSYWKAIKARPEQPAPYLPLALLLEDEDPQMAKALASVYLQLQPEAFKSGERAQDAKSIQTGDGRPVVPSVIGLSPAAATKLIRGAGLVVGAVKSMNSTQTRNTVIEQTPGARQRVSRGSSVSLTVAVDTTPLVEVPGVINDKRDTAIRKIEKVGLKVGKITERASCDKVGKVLVQNPVKKTMIRGGDFVELVIGSIGADGVNMPSLNETTRDKAESMIRDAGLRLGEVRTEEQDRPEGTVVRQSPKPGTPMARDCPVEITVTIPIEWVYVDDYTNLTKNDARQRVSNLGLYSTIRDQQSEGNPGFVVDQFPKKGGRLRKGEFVTLYVSNGSPPSQTVKVPDLYGMTKEAAEAAIKAVPGLNVGKANFVDKAGKDPNKVFDQHPPAGKEVPIGTTVDFDIANAIDGE